MAKISCSVVEVVGDVAWPVDETEGFLRDLLPWADPYIAQLLRKHQLQTGAAVVRAERPGEYADDERFGSDWNEIHLPAAGDSPYEWDAFRFRGRGIV